MFAEEIRLITHDGSVRVINNLDLFGNQKKYDKLAPIVIGDNVYLGTGAYVMPGIHIGDNCIIGARAVVTHDIPSNSVAVGIPAKVIETVDEFFNKARDKGSFEPTIGMNFDDKRKFYEEKFGL